MRWLADENFNNDILRALFRRNPALDIVRVQDVGLSGVDDPTLLVWAADAGRVLLTHDVSTVTAYAYDRVRVGICMPGVFEVSRDVPILIAVKTSCSSANAATQTNGKVRSGTCRFAELPRQEDRRKLNRRTSSVYPGDR